MEHSSGISADTGWFNIAKPQMRTFVMGIVDIKKKFFDIPFASIGSLYFRQDVPDHLPEELKSPGYPEGYEDMDPEAKS